MHYKYRLCLGGVAKKTDKYHTATPAASAYARSARILVLVIIGKLVLIHFSLTLQFRDLKLSTGRIQNTITKHSSSNQNAVTSCSTWERMGNNRLIGDLVFHNLCIIPCLLPLEKSYSDVTIS